MDGRRNTLCFNKRPKSARWAALAVALACGPYAAVVPAALVFGEVHGIDSPNDTFHITVKGKRVDVNVNNHKYEVALPPGQYTATYKDRRSTLVSYPTSTRQDISFK